MSLAASDGMVSSKGKEESYLFLLTGSIKVS